MGLVITNRQRVKKINSRRLKEILIALLAELEITEAELGIALVGAKEMAKVNWQFLQHEGSTDVITFNHAGDDSARGPSPAALHGELFICVDDAIAQAKQFRTSWQSEIVRYAVHGVLHLLGYDDLKPHLRREMKKLETRLVRQLEKKFSFAELSAAGNISR